MGLLGRALNLHADRLEFDEDFAYLLWERTRLLRMLCVCDVLGAVIAYASFNYGPLSADVLVAIVGFGCPFWFMLLFCLDRRWGCIGTLVLMGSAIFVATELGWDLALEIGLLFGGLICAVYYHAKLVIMMVRVSAWRKQAVRLREELDGIEE